MQPAPTSEHLPPGCKAKQIGWPLHWQHAAWEPQVVAPHVAPPQKKNELQVPALHVPQEPPQPSDPQVLPAQLGVQVHLPAGEQASVPAQVPQVPPQPSGPQVLPLHCGLHTQ